MNLPFGIRALHFDEFIFLKNPVFASLFSSFEIQLISKFFFFFFQVTAQCLLRLQHRLFS
jgi:hypothetical protein